MEVLSPGPEGLRRAAELLRAGAVVAFPTDTVYGLAVLASDPGAVDRVYALKGRPRHKPLVLMLPDPSRLEEWAEVDVTASAMVRRWWPGPLTLVLPARPGLTPALLSGDPPGVGVRIPNHAVALRFLVHVGEALATTSANLSGRLPAMTAEEAGALPGVGAVVDGGRAPGGVPSTVCELVGPAPRILREGAVPSAALLGG